MDGMVGLAAILGFFIGLISGIIVGYRKGLREGHEELITSKPVKPWTNMTEDHAELLGSAGRHHPHE